MEERRMRTDGSPRGKLWEAFVGSAYMAHNYRNPVIGYMSELETLPKHTLTKFFNDYYAPNNATMVLVGDVDPDEAYRVVNKYFGSWKPSDRIERTHIREPKQNGERTVRVEHKAQPFFYVGYHMPRGNTPEGTALSMFSEVVAGGKSSTMYKEIVLKQKLATSAWTHPGAAGTRYPGLFMMGATPKNPHSNTKVLKAMDQIMDQVLEKGIDPARLEEVKKRYKALYIYALESSDTIASMLLDTEMNQGGWETIFKSLQDSMDITAEEINKAARKYLIRSNRTVAQLVTKK